MNPDVIHTAEGTGPRQRVRLSQNNLALVATLLVFDSLHFVFAKLLLPRISPGVSTMYVMCISTLEVGLYGWWHGRLNLRPLRTHAGFFLSIGALIGVSMAINYQSVAFIDPGTASLLSQTSTLFGLGLGLFWLRDRLTKRQIGGALLAVAGAFLISFEQGNYLRLGSLLVLLSAFLYALHAAIAKRYGSDLELLDFFFGRLFFTALVLFILAGARGALAWPQLNVWPLLILVGTVDVVLSRALYYVALRRLSLSLHTIALTLSPIASVLWARLLFDSLPTPQQLFGGGAVIAGVLIVSLNHARRTS